MANRNKLEKLKIAAYADIERSHHVGDFEAMFNPASFSQKYQAVYSNKQGINTSGTQARFCLNSPNELNLKLMLDATISQSSSPLALGSVGLVSNQVKAFIGLTYRMNGDIHEPNYLLVHWGDLIFPCRLDSLNVTYSSFDRNGKALRAELDLALIADEDPKKRAALENKSSPDLTHSRIVKAGDTLPLLAKQIYGSSSQYLFVARANDLDDFRRLEPGTRLYFPPLPSANLQPGG